MIRQLGIQSNTKWSTPGGYCKKFEDENLTIRWYTDSFSVTINGEDSKRQMDKLALLASKESSEVNKEKAFSIGEVPQNGASDEDEDDNDDDTLERNTDSEECSLANSNDSINIDSIIEQVDNKILSLKKEFTVKVCKLNQQISGLKANGMGSPSQDKSIDDLKREKQQLKDQNCDVSEKVNMNLSLIVSDLNYKLKDYENERLSLVTAIKLLYTDAYSEIPRQNLETQWQTKEGHTQNAARTSRLAVCCLNNSLAEDIPTSNRYSALIVRDEIIEVEPPPPVADIEFLIP